MAGDAGAPTAGMGGPLGRFRLLSWLGPVAEPVYRGAIGRINRRFDAGQGVERLPVPVISVGNLSVGGTGKTPMVMHVVGWLRRAGIEPCVAMRGYRGARTDGAGSDEADSYRREFDGLAVVARPDRVVGVRELLDQGQDPTRSVGVPKAVVLDDGFQHRQIARDLDIVLVDASRPPGEDRLLPAGWLREPMESLARAQVVVITHAELVDNQKLEHVRRELAAVVKPGTLIAVCRHVWTHLETRSHDHPGEDERLGLDRLIGRKVLGCCAIGHPDAFLASLKMVVSGGDRGLGRVEEVVLPDHDPFVPRTVRRVVEAAGRMKADAIVVTDKDWSKLRNVPASTWPCPVMRAKLAMVFDVGGAELESLVVRTAAAVRA